MVGNTKWVGGGAVDCEGKNGNGHELQVNGHFSETSFWHLASGFSRTHLQVIMQLPQSQQVNGHVSRLLRKG